MSDETTSPSLTESKPYIEPPIPIRALSIQAHPDDQEFSIAGTLAKWAQAGCEVISVVITSGDAGSNALEHDETYKPALAALREKEQLAANALIGVKETVFLHYEDGILQPTLQLRHDLTRVIRKYRPDVVVTGDPTARFYGNSYLNHPDHRAAADAACDAVFPSAGTRLIFTDLLREGYEPHNVKFLYLHGSERSDTWIDISSTIERKIEALKQHQSQVGKEEDIGKWIREWAQGDGKGHGMAYAESYLKMVLVND
jgi:LmbE family N-acetylglucosaminyl deacetylase